MPANASIAMAVGSPANALGIRSGSFTMSLVKAMMISPFLKYRCAAVVWMSSLYTVISEKLYLDSGGSAVPDFRKQKAPMPSGADPRTWGLFS